MEFGSGKHIKFIPINQLATSLGPTKSSAILFFHTFSSCDTTSTISGNGEKACFETWKSMEEIDLLQNTNFNFS